jgi:hypothetical protein
MLLLKELMSVGKTAHEEVAASNESARLIRSLSASIGCQSKVYGN